VVKKISPLLLQTTAKRKSGCASVFFSQAKRHRQEQARRQQEENLKPISFSGADKPALAALSAALPAPAVRDVDPAALVVQAVALVARVVDQAVPADAAQVQDLVHRPHACPKKSLPISRFRSRSKKPLPA
jgi:hypothetical protein